MIQKTDSWKATDGNIFATLEMAQAHDIQEILLPTQNEGTTAQIVSAAALIVAEKEKVIDILTTTSKSRSKARKINGGTKKRAPKSETPIPSQFPKPSGDAITDRRRQEAAEAAK